jgi:lauroyl/myristoyl acyltransferase
MTPHGWVWLTSAIAGGTSWFMWNNFWQNLAAAIPEASETAASAIVNQSVQFAMTVFFVAGLVGSLLVWMSGYQRRKESKAGDSP